MGQSPFQLQLKDQLEIVASQLAPLHKWKREFSDTNLRQKETFFRHFNGSQVGIREPTT